MTIKGAPSNLRSYIHYDPERTDYTVSEEELNQLHQGSPTIWKDVCLVCISLGVPTVANAVVEFTKTPTLGFTLELFINSLVGSVSVALSAFSAFAWHRGHRSTKSLVEAIKAKPRLEVIPSMSNIGALPTVSLQDGSTAMDVSGKVDLQQGAKV